VNCSVSETLGFAERELVGKKIDILIPEYLRKFHDEKMR
jgi:PAS domain S-box-containing protein